MLLIAAALGFIGQIYCDHSSLPLGYPTEEVTAPLGYPIEGYDTGATAGGGYYSQYPSAAGGQYDYSSLAYGDTDRQGTEITVPVILIAIASAIAGAVMAPFAAGIVAQLSSLDLALPTFPGFENKFIKNRSKYFPNESGTHLVSLVSKAFKKFLKG